MSLSRACRLKSLRPERELTRFRFDTVFFRSVHWFAQRNFGLFSNAEIGFVLAEPDSII